MTQKRRKNRTDVTPKERAKMDQRNAQARERRRQRNAKPRVSKPRGRPTKYKEEYCDLVIENGRKGGSLTAAAVAIGVVRATLYEWQDTKPSFLDACTRAREASMEFWENLARKQAAGETEGGSTGALTFMMTNQFQDDYRSRREVTHEGNLKLVTMDFTGYEEDEDDDG